MSWPDDYECEGQLSVFDLFKDEEAEPFDLSKYMNPPEEGEAYGTNGNDNDNAEDNEPVS